MSEGLDETEQLRTKVSNLENDVATLTGENDRLQSEIKAKDEVIDDLKEVEKSLIDQIKAAKQPSGDIDDIKAQNDRQGQHIIDLENKLKEYQDFESSRTSLEKQLQDAKDKAEGHFKELVATKSQHELDVKQLRTKIAELSANDDESNPDFHQPIELKIEVVAGDEAPEGEELSKDEADPKEMSEKNSKLKKKLVQEKKKCKRMQEEMDTMKNELLGMQNQNDEKYQGIHDQMHELRMEVKEKMDLINVLENENRELEVRTKKAEDEARETVQELEAYQEQNEEHNHKFGDQDEQIAQMHEDMRRLLEFKNELEALIEEQNKDIEDKTQRINKLVSDLKTVKGDVEAKDTYIKNLEKQNKEIKTKHSATSGKFNRLKQGKVTELQKKNRDLASEVHVLKGMVKSSKNEVRTKEISIKKYQKRLTSLEKISKIRSKVSEMNSMHSQNSQRNRSMGRHRESYDYEDTYDDNEDHDEVIVEAEENLEATGQQDPYYDSAQNVKTAQYSKTPNIRVSKNLNNSKIASLTNISPERLKNDNSMSKLDQRDPFKNKVSKGYEYYKDSLVKPDFKNNSYGVRGIFTHQSDQFELPAIKESQGAIILDRKRLEHLKKENEDIKNTSNVSNTYKQSFRVFAG